MKILFQGDSITDASRDKSNMHDLGKGYASFAAKLLRDKFPEVDFEFINLGINGNRTEHLLERLENDFIDIQPDIVSILVGVNDVHNATPDEYEERYCKVLTAIRERTNAKIMLLEPFVFPVNNMESVLHVDLDSMIRRVRKLAREFAEALVPTDGLLASAYNNEDPTLYSRDGVHPTEYCAEYIGRVYADYISDIIRSML